MQHFRILNQTAHHHYNLNELCTHSKDMYLVGYGQMVENTVQ